MKKLFLIFILVVLFFIPNAYADSNETSQGHWIEAMDFDGSSPPAGFPDCNGSSWQSWSPKDYDCDRSPGSDSLDTVTYRTSPRSWRLRKESGDFETTGLQFSISPAVTKLHVRFYTYFTTDWNACNQDSNCGDEYIHYIFLNTARAGVNFGVDILSCTDEKPWDIKCRDVSNSDTVLGFHSYASGPGENDEWQKGPDDAGDCKYIEDDLMGGWHAIEWMFDLTNELRSLWIDGTFQYTITMTEGNHSSINWIFITYYLDNSDCNTSDVSGYIDNIVLATDYIGLIDEVDVTPPQLSTAVIASNGTTLTLTFSENVTQGGGYNDADWDIDASGSGSDIGITYSSGNGTGTHTYTIASTIQSGETVNIDFNGDTDSEEDGSGNDLAAIVSDSVTNNSTEVPPTLSTAVVAANGTTLTLTFNENVTQGTGYQDADWNVDGSVTGSDISVTYSSGNGTDTHVYTVGQTIQSGETVDIDFNGDADSMEDDDDYDLAAIVSDSVTNNSTQGSETPPTLTGSVIASNGTTLTLTFDENVTQGSGYNDTDWDVDASVTGNDIGVTYSSGNGTATHTYTIASTIQSSDTVDIDFNGDTDSEEDGAGDDLAAIVSDSVTNNSTQGDTDPPTPNPAEWSVVPVASGWDSIDMTASTGSDPLPISYFFDFDETMTDCGSDGTQFDATDSGWQLEDTTYTDSGLYRNKCFAYRVQMRDSNQNTGTASSFSKIYTWALKPGTPSLSNPTSTTLDFAHNNPGNPNQNPTTLFAVQCTATSPTDSTWQGKWVNASGNPVASEVWLSDATWDAITIGNLTNVPVPVTYDFKSKAKNQDGFETALSLPGQGTTGLDPTSITEGGCAISTSRE